MEINKTNNLLSKRKKVGYAIISSKNNNYKISSVYLSPYILKKKEDDDLANKFEQKMLKYFSYEIIINQEIKFFFDFDTCRKELDIDVEEYLPYPYLIEIHIIDMNQNAKRRNYILSLITEEISDYKNGIFDITLKKAECPDNDDFVAFQSEKTFKEYYIVHKNEEDWKKFQIYQTLMRK